MPICKYFEKGTCHYGDKCWNEHIPNRGRDYYYSRPTENDYSNQYPKDNSYSTYHYFGENYQDQRGNYNVDQRENYVDQRENYYDDQRESYNNEQRESYNNDQRENYNDYVYTDIQPNRYSSDNRTSNPKAAQKSAIIKEIATELGEKKEWIYTCFGTSEVDFPQFIDLSPEELRWATIKAKKTGQSHILEQNLNNAQNFIDLSQKDLLSSEAHLSNKLDKLTKGEKAFSTSIYLENLIKMATGLPYDYKASSLTSSMAPSFFGAQAPGDNRATVQKSSPSIFNLNATQKESLFGKPATSLFGKTVPPSSHSNVQGVSYNAPVLNARKSIFAVEDNFVSKPPSNSKFLVKPVKNVGEVATIDNASLQQYRSGKFILGQFPFCPPPREFCAPH